VKKEKGKGKREKGEGKKGDGIVHCSLSRHPELVEG